MNFLDRFSENSEVSNLIKFRPLGANLFRSDRRTDRQARDEASNLFSPFGEHPL